MRIELKNFLNNDAPEQIIDVFIFGPAVFFPALLEITLIADSFSIFVKAVSIYTILFIINFCCAAKIGFSIRKSISAGMSNFIFPLLIMFFSLYQLFAHKEESSKVRISKDKEAIPTLFEGWDDEFKKRANSK